MRHGVLQAGYIPYIEKASPGKTGQKQELWAAVQSGEQQAGPTSGVAEGSHSSSLSVLPRHTQHRLICRQESSAWGLGLERQHLIFFFSFFFSPPGWDERWLVDTTEAVWHYITFSWVLSFLQFMSPVPHFYQHLRRLWGTGDLGDRQPVPHSTSLPAPLPNTSSHALRSNS